MKNFLVLALLFTSVFGAQAQTETGTGPQGTSTTVTTKTGTKTTRTIYPENQTLDFEGLSLEGELKAPGEFYFQNRNQERFDSLTKRRLNFRREMLRDSIQSN